MNQYIDTRRLFSVATQQAFLENVHGYVSKEQGFQDRIEVIRSRHAHERLIRMDLGQNPDGCAPTVRRLFEQILAQEDVQAYLEAYPDFDTVLLRRKIARLHGIRPEWILVAAGLEQMIQMIAAAVLDPRDRFVVTNPGFFLFDEFSRRQGGIPVEITLDEGDAFGWNHKTMEQCREVFQKLRPKLVWIANPNNPAGQGIDAAFIEELVNLAHDNLAFIVIDEAYGEYTDTGTQVTSASSLLGSYDNLIVLRSFSKAYGLPGIRIGYAMCGNEHVLTALRMHRTNYPMTRLSYALAMEAIDQQSYVQSVRERTLLRRTIVDKALASCAHVRLFPSNSCIALLRCSHYGAAELSNRLESKGILVAPVTGLGHVAKSCVRLTLGNEQDNALLVKALSGLGAQDYRPPTTGADQPAQVEA